MKLLGKLLENCRHLLFLDLEGTQFGHEVIAIGAVLTDCNENYVPVGEVQSFKCYVKPKTKIGTVVTTMTGIDEDLLEKEGVSFEEAMQKLNDFLGPRANKVKVLTYGNQDAHMLFCSYNLADQPSLFLKNFVHYLTRNNVDIGTFFSRYLRGKKNEMVSLTHMRVFFEIPPSGDAHDPLVDATDLFNIYKAFTSDKELIKRSYKKLIIRSQVVPQPIKPLVVNLIDGKTVTPDDLERVLNLYFD